MKVPSFTIPVLIVVMTVFGLHGSQLIRVPSAEVDFPRGDFSGESSRAVFIIDGVTCRDTALSAIGNLSEVSGIHRAVAYASYNRVDVEFDPAVTDPAAICQAFHDPVYVSETGEFVFDMFKVLEVNGKRIEADASNNKEESL